MCARYLHEIGREIFVVLTKKPEHVKSTLWRQNYDVLYEIVPKDRFLDELPESLDGYTIIDALFGIGFKGKWREEYRAIRDRLGQRSGQIISIDVPSGFPDDPLKTGAVYALEYADELLERYCKNTGAKLSVLPIGIPDQAKKWSRSCSNAHVLARSKASRAQR